MTTTHLASPTDQTQTTPETLSQEQIDFYRANGFVKIPGIISKEEAATFRQRCLDIAEEFKKAQEESGAEKKSVFTQILNRWPEDAVIKDAVLHPNITGIAKKLAGVPLRLWHDHILIKEPHNGAQTEWHQDQPYWPHKNGSNPISCWLALCDVPADRGSMSFIPGAQKRDDLGVQILTDKRSLFGLAPDLEYEPKVTLPLRAGDCTFHHGRCPHMANANDTDEYRVALVSIYIDQETIFDGRKHAVTKDLDLEPGTRIEGELFPEI
jgi:ectoine hydroxylase-related dioxygenase (phytanoyl-CoA dioxygenase family)